MGRKFEQLMAERRVGSADDQCVAPMTGKRTPPADAPLAVYLAPVAVVGLGATFILISLFLPYLSSTEVTNIYHNSGIESDPFITLGAIGGGLAAARYYRTGSRKAANSTIFVGLWFTGWCLFHGFTSQLHRLNCNSGDYCNLDTSPAIGLWVMGVGSAIIALGGLMMRNPNSGYLLASGSVTTPEEQTSRDANSKICPACAETIKAQAKICRFCHTNLETYAEAKTSEA